MKAHVGKGNIGFLTSMRGFAAFYVMISHVWYQIWPAVPAPYGYAKYPEGVTAVFTGWLYYGHFGVVAFIFISGFCLMIPVIRNGSIGSIGHFFYRRCRRIMPSYYAALLLSGVLAITVLSEKTGTQWDISIPVTWGGFFSHLFLIQHLYEPTQINYPLWSISVEFHLYFLFPLFVILWRWLGAFGMFFITATLVVALMAIISVRQVEGIPPSFVGLILHFVLGMVCCNIVYRASLPAYLVRMAGPAALSLFAILCATCWVLGHDRVEDSFYVIDLIVIAGLFCGFIYLSFYEGPIRSILEKPLFIGVGDMSYSLYLTHAPVIHLLWLAAVSQLDETQGFITLVLISIPGSLLVGYLFHLLFERPFLSNKTGRRPQH